MPWVITSLCDEKELCLGETVREGGLRGRGRRGISVGRIRRELKAGGSCIPRRTEHPSPAASGSCSSWRSARWSRCWRWSPGPASGAAFGSARRTGTGIGSESARGTATGVEGSSPGPARPRKPPPGGCTRGARRRSRPPGTCRLRVGSPGAGGEGERETV